MDRDGNDSAWRWSVGAGAVALLLFASGLRVVNPTGKWHGHEAGFWSATLALSAVLSRIGVGILDVASARIPVTRLLLPGLIAVELALLLVGRGSRLLGATILGAFEVGLVLFTLVTLFVGRDGGTAATRWEELAEVRLARFLPPMIARWTATELTLMGAALAAPFRRARPLGEGEFGYFQGSPLRFLPFLLALALPADLLLVWVLVPARMAVLRWVIDASGIYAILWMGGVGDTMKRRPHRVSAAEIEVSTGALRRALFPATAIRGVTHLPSFDSKRRLRAYARERGAAIFCSTRVPVVEIEVDPPARIRTSFSARERTAGRLLVAVDDPLGFANALTGARASSASPYMK